MRTTIISGKLPSRTVVGSKRNQLNKGFIDPDFEGPRLLLKTREACKLLGGIHPRTLARLEKSGEIRSLKLIRHRLYAAEDIEAFVASLRGWGMGR